MILRIFLLIPILGLFTLLAPRMFTAVYAQPRLHNVDTAPDSRVAIVFGAGLRRDGTPTPVLRHRVERAVELYKAGKVEKVLMSGDGRYGGYNEPAAMRLYAMRLGLPEEAIVLDFAGRRTYDTCYRARHIFGVDQALLVTQAFHLPRAIYLCNQLGVQAAGVPADPERSYRRFSLAFWNSRELVATVVALWEVHFTRPLPVLGNPEPIFPPEMTNQ